VKPGLLVLYRRRSPCMETDRVDSCEAWTRTAQKLDESVICTRVHIDTSGYATWFTAGGAIRIAHYDVIDDVITLKL